MKMETIEQVWPIARRCASFLLRCGRHLRGVPAVAALFSAPVAAAELHSWPDNRPVSLPAGGHEIQVVNVWASWCVPCRREMPLLSRWHEQQQRSSTRPKVKLTGISLDKPEAMKQFLQQTPVRYTQWRYGGQDSRAWMRSIGNPVGALPFTLIQAPQCGFKTTLLGEVDAAKLDAAVAAARQKCAQAG
ncbi:thiol-disulfide isomerase/thioredoxin [Neisseria sp. HSC-16F19]|nr:TlpA disulfide reductase family protein [Neisseria sp. HSC-16F19]MCP2041758.1 thiol-disulfide isomerase/thioredoxin [Neisseria sp. HSC-16F19]